MQAGSGEREVPATSHSPAAHTHFQSHTQAQTQSLAQATSAQHVRAPTESTGLNDDSGKPPYWWFSLA